MRACVCYACLSPQLRKSKKNKMSKEKEVILRVLEMYKQMPFLWDKNHPEYRNKFSRANGNHALLEVYKKYDESATVQIMNKKIQNLRTNYYKELRKVQESQQNGTDEQEIYEPTVWYYDAFSFLGDNSEHCHSRKNSLKTESVSFSSSEGEGSYQNSETYSTPPVKKRKFTNPIVYKDTNNSPDHGERPPHMKDEEWEIFGKSIGLQLRDLDKKQLTIAQKIISDAIYYAKFNLLTQNSYVNLGTSPPPPP